NSKVRIHLRATSGYKPLEDVYAKLAELADAPSMSRTLRRLTIPESVKVIARGDTSVISKRALDLGERKWAFALSELKESARLRMSAEDYYTPAKRITLVAPPSVRRLSVDKEEPAYLYHRIQGGVQEPLAGQKQL